MKNKTIKAVLNKKLNSWIASIKDPYIRSLVRCNTIVTGGCIASMLTNDVVNDYDIYFKNKETTLEVALYYAKEFNKLNNKNVIVVSKECIVSSDHFIDHVDFDKTEDQELFLDSYSRVKNKALNDNRVCLYLDGFSSDKPDIATIDNDDEDACNDIEENGEYRPVFLTQNAITLSDKVQIIIRYFGDVDEIHSNFDFTHCTNSYDFNSGELHLKIDAVRAVMDKELIYQGSKYPICSMIRTRKFIKRGYQINAGQYLKMAYQISELDLNDIDILEEQLTGVDSLYFSFLIAALRNKESKAEEIDSLYITEIIDRIFS